MISQNDLYDITYALTIVRDDIQCRFNVDVLRQMTSVLQCKENAFEDNQIRKSLAVIEGLNKKRWDFIYHNNVYVRHSFLKNQVIYQLLFKCCNAAISALESKEFEKAYDLIECFHCLPDIIADNGFAVPKSYWKIYIKPYRDKWDATFLVEEQKLLK